MKGHTGELLFALMLGVLLAATVSWLVAGAVALAGVLIMLTTLLVGLEALE